MRVLDFCEGKRTKRVGGTAVKDDHNGVTANQRFNVDMRTEVDPLLVVLAETGKLGAWTKRFEV